MKTKSIKIVFAIVTVLLLSLVIAVSVSAADTGEVTIEYRKSGDYNNVAETAKTAADGSITLRDQLEHTEDGNFYGWFTEDGTLYEAGKEYVFTNDTVLYEAYGITASSATDVKNAIEGGYYVRVEKDLNFSGKLLATAKKGILHIVNKATFKMTNNEMGMDVTANGAGIMFFGDGTIDLSKSTGADKAVVRAIGGSSAGGEVYVGKGVTVITTSNFVRTQNGMTIKVKIYGKVVANYLFYKQGKLYENTAGIATFEIFETAEVTINKAFISSMSNITGNKDVAISIYGGKINIPSADKSVFNDKYSNGNNTPIYEYIISGGTWNVELITSGDDAYKDLRLADGMSCVAYNGSYVVIPTGSCPATGKEHEVGEITSIAFANGFDKPGTTKYKCAKCGGECDGTIEAMFAALGYATSNSNTSIYGGFTVNLDALSIYEVLKGPIKFGLIGGNANTDLTFENGKLQSEKAFQVEMTDRKFSKFGIMLNGFDPEVEKYIDFKFVMAVYVIDESSNMSFIQKEAETVEGVTSYYADKVNFTIGENKTELGAMTLKQIVLIQSKGETVLVPAKVEEEIV